MIDFTVARDKLLQFQTTEELATFFKYEQVTGIKGKRDNCVVAHWMQQQTGTLVQVSHCNMWDSEDVDSMLLHPKVLKRFIICFDIGDYPELEEHND